MYVEKKTTSMGSGRGGGNEETWGRDQERGQEISLGDQSQRYVEDHDFRQRRSGQRFHYRRKARWRKPFTGDWEDFGSSYLLLAWISLFLATLPILSYTTELANCFATCAPPWTAFITSPRLSFTPSQVPLVSALHCRILAAAPATFGAMCANATNFIHFRVASDQVGLRVHWSRALAKFFTLPYSIQHLQTIPTIHAQRRSRLLVTAPPITCNRSPARPDRTTSSRLPVRLRPAVPPACRPNYPGCLAWTRPLPGCSARRTPITSSRPHTRLHRTDSSSFPASPRPAASPACRPICPGRPAGTRPPLSRSAQRLRASKPCHPVPDSTPCTFRKYDRKKTKRKALFIEATTSSRNRAGAFVCDTLGTSSGRAPTRCTFSLCHSHLRFTTIDRFAQERVRQAPDH